MKPNFALGITEAGVTLWQRGAAGWLRVGAVGLDDPDLDGAFAGLVTKARKLEPGRIATKLVIPDDQILYCQVHAPATDPETRRAQILAALEGRTPFPVTELEFDWVGEDPDPQLAVVARETLLEAEEFATTHGLNPVCYVAAPAADLFPQEPFFGPTRHAGRTLEDIRVIERDTSVLVEVGIAELPKTPLAASVQAPAEASAKPEAASTPAVADKDSTSQQGKSKPSGDDTGFVVRADRSPETPLKEASAFGFGKPSSNTKSETAYKGEGADRSFFAPPPKSAKADENDAEHASNFNFKSRRAPAHPSDITAGQKTDRKIDESADRTARGFGAKKQHAVSAKAATAADKLGQLSARVKAGAGRSVQSLTARFATALASGRTGLAKAKQIKTPQSLTGSLAKTADKTKVAQPPKSRGDAKSGAADATASSGTQRPEATKAAPSTASSAPHAPGAGPAQSAPPRQRTDPLEKLRALTGTKSTPAKAPDPEAEKLTIFGARGRADAGPDGARKALLIGGGIMLVLLAAAIWAFYFTRADIAQQPAPIAQAPAPELGIEAPDDALADLAITEDQAIESALAADMATEIGIDAETQPELSAVTDQTTPDPAAPETASAPAPEILQGRVAGVRSSGLIAPQDMAAMPDISAAPVPFDPDALPPLRGSEDAQIIAAAPADGVPGTDAVEGDGDTPLIAQGEDALQIQVTPGRPAVVPPEKPVRFTIPETPAAPEPEPEVVIDAPQQDAVIDPVPAPDEADLVITVTPGTPPVVPPQRPAELLPQQSLDDARAPEQMADDGSDHAMAPPAAAASGGIALTALRPASRPDDLAPLPQDQAEQALFQDLTPQAVANSLRPADRPSQFAAIVQRAMQAAPAQQAAPVQTAAAPARTAAAAAPNIPSSASVAREATQRSAINLRQANLIGVMGTPSNRRALVRLSNGRVVTVRVGENLDGGTVTAISDTELRYNRRGRDVVLRFPS